jgi:hypothetical protein
MIQRWKAFLCFDDVDDGGVHFCSLFLLLFLLLLIHLVACCFSAFFFGIYRDMGQQARRKRLMFFDFVHII